MGFKIFIGGWVGGPRELKRASLRSAEAVAAINRALRGYAARMGYPGSFVNVFIIVSSN